MGMLNVMSLSAPRNVGWPSESQWQTLELPCNLIVLSVGRGTGHNGKGKSTRGTIFLRKTSLPFTRSGGAAELLWTVQSPTRLCVTYWAEWYAMMSCCHVLHSRFMLLAFVVPFTNRLMAVC